VKHLADAHNLLPAGHQLLAGALAIGHGFFEDICSLALGGFTFIQNNRNLGLVFALVANTLLDGLQLVAQYRGTLKLLGDLGADLVREGE